MNFHEETPKGRHRKTLLYIAGPMTGLPHKNMPAFWNAQEDLLGLGYAVLNPARHELLKLDWTGYMKLGITDAMEADGIALLPGWDYSAGARLEKRVAEGLGKPVREITWWMDKERTDVYA